MNHPDHPYNAEAIRRYLQGEMSETEMHALEKAALEDPLLADAIEGFEGSIAIHGADKTMQDVEALQQALTARYQQVPVRKFPWWQVAAAAAVIIIAGVATIRYYNNPSDKLAATIPDTTHTLPAQEKVPAQVADTLLQGDVAAHLPAAPAAKNQQQENAVAENNNDRKAGSVAPALVAPPQLEPQSRASVSSTARDTTSLPVQDAAPSTASSAKRLQKNEDPTHALHRISGRVYNTNREPLSKASLVPSTASVQSHNRVESLQTDRTGFFSILSPDTAVVVKVSATGYQQQQFRLRNNPAQNNLVLKNQYKGKAALDVRNSDRGNTGETLAMPEGGWPAFDAYVEKNKVYPAEGVHPGGEVVVAFQVNEQGQLHHFQIVQSLSKSFDEEAIRLIRDGPAWKLIEGSNARVTITIHY